MKKLLGILVLGLLWCSNVYAVDCDGTKPNSTTVKYVCEDNDTMTVNEGTTLQRNWVVISPQLNNAQN